MADTFTPRTMAKMILEGQSPSRPLLLPIVFQLGARIENLSDREYRSNPTRIAKALRQVHGTLGLDGVTCYFDSDLEIEAMNVLLGQEGPQSGCNRVFERVAIDKVHDFLDTPERIAAAGRVPIACDVLKRAKTLLMGEPLLMVGVSGPFCLADQLRNPVDAPDVAPPELVEAAAGVTAEVSKRFLEVGANAILIYEKPPLTSYLKNWADSLAPIVNVIRFYEALPIVIFDAPASPEVIAALTGSCEGVICPTLLDPNAGKVQPSASASPALSLPLTCFQSEHRESVIRSIQPAAGADLCLVTSQDDLPPQTDLKYLAGFLTQLRGLQRVG